MRNKYYARKSSDKKEEVIEHLRETAKRAGDYGKIFGLEEICRAAGLSHDIGKHTESFQEVLEGKKTHIDHSWPAAIFWNDKQKECKDRTASWYTYEILKIVTAYHHSNITSKNEVYKLFDSKSIKVYLEKNRTELDRLSDRKLSIKDIQEYEEVSDFITKNNLIQAAKPLDVKFINSNIKRMLTARMIYSCLVDADYTSSAMFYDSSYESKNTAKLTIKDINEALHNLDTYRNNIKKCSTANTEINKLRDKVYNDCEKFSKKIVNDTLCKLSAPTGLGKTLSLLKFGLETAKRLSKDRIIVVLPYLALVEDAKAVYDEIFGAENVLVDTSTNDIDADPDNLSREMISRWSAKVIITTNVNFFESLFQSKSTKCRKLHNIANSVLLFDESQTLPPHLLSATLRTLRALVENFKVTMVLSTATQPEYSEREDLSKCAKDIEEIISSVDTLYEDYSNVKKINYIFHKNKESYKSLAKYARNHKQILYMLNTKKQVRKLYDELKSMYTEREIVYITTNLCPEHRIDILKRVRTILAEGSDLIVISSQCIEAGVDFDFPVLFRQYAPFESLIQAAGRCNRNCKCVGEMHIFSLDGEKFPNANYQNAASIVMHMKNIVSLNDLTKLKEYYKALYQNEYYKKDNDVISEAIDNSSFSDLVSNYKIIDKNISQINVITDYNKKLYDCIYSELASNNYCITKKIMRKALRVTVSTYKETDELKSCTRLYINTKDGKEAINWYIVESSVGAYDNTLGLSNVANKK